MEFAKQLKGRVPVWLKGKTLSEEHKRKLCLARKGKPSPSKGLHWSEKSRISASRNRQGINNPFYGKVHTEETKQRISKLKKGKVLSEEHRLALSKAQAGRQHSEETKKKMRASALLRWRKNNKINKGIKYDTNSNASPVKTSVCTFS